MSRSVGPVRAVISTSSAISIENGVKLNARNDEPLCRACESGHLDIVRYLHENGIELSARNDEPLCRACESGHLDVVRYLHENGIELNARNNEPLCRACESGHLDVVRYLYENGVDLNARNNEPLCLACQAVTSASSAIFLSRRGACRRPITSRCVARLPADNRRSCGICTMPAQRRNC